MSGAGLSPLAALLGSFQASGPVCSRSGGVLWTGGHCRSKDYSFVVGYRKVRGVVGAGPTLKLDPYSSALFSGAGCFASLEF